MSTTMYEKLSPIFSAYADKINQNASDITDVNTSLSGKADKSDMLNAFPTATATGAVASFTDGAELPVKDLTVTVTAVQSGTGDPSPDNVRPISGWTGATITRTGKNLLPCPYQCGDSGTTVHGISYTVNSDRSITLDGTSGGSSYIWLYGNNRTPVPSWIKANKKISVSSGNGSSVGLGKGSLQMIFYGESNTTIQEGTQNTPSDLSQYRGFAVVLYVSTGTTLENVTVYPMVAYEDSLIPYEAYTGESYSIDWISEAGTVYGGSLDATTGVLTVTHGNIASYGGETLPGEWISDRDVYVEGATPTTGAQVVYALAEAVTYQLTAHEVSTLLGSNNIFADCGDSSVTYRADITMFVNRKIAEAISALS